MEKRTLRIRHGEKLLLHTRDCPFCILEKRIARSLSLDATSDVPSKLNRSLHLYASHFQWGQQEDAHEFLRYVLDSCHNTCLELLLNDHGTNTSRATTVVEDIFGGALLSQVTCLSCGFVSSKTDQIMDVNLDLCQSRSLDDAFARFFQPELLDGDNKYNCSGCCKLSPAKKHMFLLQAPNVLVVQLKRFEGMDGIKINRHIAFQEVLSLSNFMSNATQDPEPVYNLFGSIVHSGHSPDSGHYYAYVKDPSGHWYCCNDSNVSLSSSQEVLSEKAYILFYVRSNQGHGSIKPPPSCNVQSNVPSHSYGQLTSCDASLMDNSKIAQGMTDGFIHSKARSPISDDIKEFKSNGAHVLKPKRMLDVEDSAVVIPHSQCSISDVVKKDASYASYNKFSDNSSPEGLMSIIDRISRKARMKLQSCGWTDQVYDFMRARKRACVRAAGCSLDHTELRRLLIADARKNLMSHIPQELKEDLIKDLRKSFSEHPSTEAKKCQLATHQASSVRASRLTSPGGRSKQRFLDTFL